MISRGPMGDPWAPLFKWETRMKRLWLSVFVILALGALIYFMADGRAVEAAKPVKTSCASCHQDFDSVLPKEHPAVNGKDLTACLPCHEPNMEGEPRKNDYSVRMHLAHVPPKGTLGCTACHNWTPGRSFGLIGVKGSRGAPKKEDMGLMKEIFLSWASSQYMDNLHAKAGVDCVGCHGKDLARADDTVENPRCLECHGPMETLAKKAEPKDFSDRNPHKSHLGDINCTVCHHAHGESKVYCLDCHQKFVMRIPGGAEKRS
jgi:hypothetical protein